MKRLFITGDKHGQFGGLKVFLALAQTTVDDILVVLGDVGVNYDLDINDLYLKRSLTKHPITFVFVHGNHEERPANVAGYKLIDSPFGFGKVWHDPKFPNQFFLDNGIHTILNKVILAIGGAYSVDKEYRLMNGYKWFKSEQLTNEEKWQLTQISCNGRYDFVFTHTCPTNFIPQDMFLTGLDQSKIDRSSEDFLQVIHDQITYDQWYCGHWHADRTVDKMNFLFHDYKEIAYEE